MKKEEKKICKFRRKSLYNFTILGNSSIQDFMRLKDIDICEASFKNKVNSNNKSWFNIIICFRENENIIANY